MGRNVAVWNVLIKNGVDEQQKMFNKIINEMCRESVNVRCVYAVPLRAMND
jgi:hypothetical protein